MSFIITLLIALLVIAGVISSLILLAQRNSKLAKLLKKYEPIIDIEKESLDIRNQALKETENIKNSTTAELEDIRAHASNDLTQIKSMTKQAEKKFEEINATVANLQSMRKQLQHDIDLLEEKDFLYSQGLYEPRYDFNKLVDYERKLNNVREKQKSKIQDQTAIDFFGEVENSKHIASIKKIEKIILRAFNGECDFLISKVNYKNVVTFEQRITKAYEQLNKLSASLNVLIAEEYKNFKIE